MEKSFSPFRRDVTGKGRDDIVLIYHAAVASLLVSPVSQVSKIVSRITKLRDLNEVKVAIAPDDWLWGTNYLAIHHLDSKYDDKSAFSGWNKTPDKRVDEMANFDGSRMVPATWRFHVRDMDEQPYKEVPIVSVNTYLIRREKPSVQAVGAALLTVFHPIYQYFEGGYERTFREVYSETVQLQKDHLTACNVEPIPYDPRTAESEQALMAVMGTKKYYMDFNYEDWLQAIQSLQSLAEETPEMIQNILSLNIAVDPDFLTNLSHFSPRQDEKQRFVKLREEIRIDTYLPGDIKFQFDRKEEWKKLMSMDRNSRASVIAKRYLLSVLEFEGFNRWALSEYEKGNNSIEGETI